MDDYELDVFLSSCGYLINPGFGRNMAGSAAEPVAALVAVDFVASAPQGSPEPFYPISIRLCWLLYLKVVDLVTAYAGNLRSNVAHMGYNVHFVALRAVTEYVATGANACLLPSLFFFAL